MTGKQLVHAVLLQYLQSDEFKDLLTKGLSVYEFDDIFNAVHDIIEIYKKEIDYQLKSFKGGE